MECPKCKATIDDDSKYCTYCGILINNNKESKVDKEKEKLLDAYIGNNSDQIKEKSFSLPTFLLGEFYFAYRKMYLLAFLSFITLIICLFLGSYIALGLVIRNTIFAFFFNKLYCNYANHKIDKLDKSLSEEEKIALCKKKGGTSILSICIVSVPLFLAFLFFFILYIAVLTADKGYIINDKPELYDLTYKIPKNFESSKYNNYDSKYYSYMTENYNQCTFSITQALSNNFLTTEEYIKAITNLNENNDIKEVKINNYTWSGTIISHDNTQTYYYATKYKDHYYSLKFDSYNDDECINYYKEVANSLKFK